MLIEDPSRFSGKPLILRRVPTPGFEDYRVLADGLNAGRIMQVDRSYNRKAWLWTLTGPYCGAPELSIATSGEVETLEAAKDGFRTAFDAWLAWAIAGAAQHEQLAWHG
jgi:hypothetical protein